MIRDLLAELVHASHVDSLRKVRASFAPGDHNNDFVKLISVLDLNLLRDVGTIINETVRRPGVGAIPSLTRDSSTGRNLSPLVVFAFGSISTRSWTTENIYTLGSIPSSRVATV